MSRAVRPRGTGRRASSPAFPRGAWEREEGNVEELIITQPDEVAAFCTRLAAYPHFGFDTEFVGEDSYHPRLCLVQVATPEGLYLIDPLTAGPLDAFWKLVVDPARVVVVHAGREEVRLCRFWTGQVPGN